MSCCCRVFFGTKGMFGGWTAVQIASALVAAVGNAQKFRSGRELAAWLGLVPRQHSRGGRSLLLGISKRGDRNLRALMIHGAPSALRVAERK